MRPCQTYEYEVHVNWEYEYEVHVNWEWEAFCRTDCVCESCLGKGEFHLQVSTFMREDRERQWERPIIPRNVIQIPDLVTILKTVWELIRVLFRGREGRALGFSPLPSQILLLPQQVDLMYHTWIWHFLSLNTCPEFLQNPSGCTDRHMHASTSPPP